MWRILSVADSRKRQCPVVALLLIPGVAAAGDRAFPVRDAITAAAGMQQAAVSILPARTGAPMETRVNGGASLSLGRVAYHGGRPGSGVAARRDTSSMALSTAFDLKVVCSGDSVTSLAEVSASLTILEPSLTFRLDGAELSSAPMLVVLRCGSVTEHWLEIEVPVTRESGPIVSSVYFSAVPKP